MENTAQLKRQIETLRKLAEKETDEAELKNIAEEIDSLHVEIGKLEAKAEVEEAKAKAAVEADTKAVEKARTESPLNVQTPRIEVGTPGNYKGFQLKRELDYCVSGATLPGMYKGLFEDRPGVQQRMKERPEAAEKVLKTFVDLYTRAASTPIAKASMQEGTNSEGGYLVPEEQRFEILAYMRESSVSLRECTVIPMTSDSMTMPRELAKVDVTITAEESDATQSDPTFEQVTLTARRFDAFSVASNELIQDAANPGGIAGLLLDQFTEAIGLKSDSVVFLGTGSPMSGVFKSAGYSTIIGNSSTSGSTAFSTLTEATIRDAASQIAEEELGNAKWYMNKAVMWQNVRGLKDDNGQYLLNQVGMGQAGPDTLWGYPIIRGSKMPSTSGVSTGFIVFGNLRGVYIGERLGNLRLMMDPYVLAKSYQTRFFFFTRWGHTQALPKRYTRILTSAS